MLAARYVGGSYLLVLLDKSVGSGRIDERLLGQVVGIVGVEANRLFENLVSVDEKLRRKRRMNAELVSKL